MKTPSINFYLFLIVSLSFLAHNALSQNQKLDEYLQVAAANNPALKARHQEYYSALEKVPQAGALPDPELSFSFFLGKNGMFMERFMGEQLTDISLMQMFPWTGTLSTAKSEASYMARMKFSAFHEEKINLFHEVRTAWYSLYKIEKELILLNKERNILKAYHQLALTRFSTGTSETTPVPTSGSTDMQGNVPATPSPSGGMNMGGNTATRPSQSMNTSGMGAMSGTSSESMIDVLLIQSQMKELDTRIATLEDSRKPLQAKFNNLLNVPMATEIQIADTLIHAQLPALLSVIQDSVLQNHPMIKMYEWDEKAREAQRKMALLMGRPMIGVGLSYMVFRPRNDELMNVSMGGDNMFMPMVTVNLPIYRKKYTAQRNEAGYLQQAAKSNREASQLTLLSELENLLFEYERSLKQLQLLQEQMVITEQTIRLMVTAYATGRSSMEEILRQRQAWLTYRQQQLANITEQHITVSSIRRLMAADI